MIKDVNGTPRCRTAGAWSSRSTGRNWGETERVLRPVQLLDIPAISLGRGWTTPATMSSARSRSPPTPNRVVLHRGARAGLPGRRRSPNRCADTLGLRAHVLGYLGQISEDKLAIRGSPTTPRGRDRRLGIEGIYERYLAGIAWPAKYRVNSTGENLRPDRPPAARRRRRRVAHARCRDARARGAVAEGWDRARPHDRGVRGGYLRANGGAAIVLDPQTARSRRCLLAVPTFDPALFTRASRRGSSIAGSARDTASSGESRDPGAVPAGLDLQAVRGASALQRDRDDGSVVRLPAELDRAVRRERPRRDAVRVQQLDHATSDT